MSTTVKDLEHRLLWETRSRDRTIAMLREENRRLRKQLGIDEMQDEIPVVDRFLSIVRDDKGVSGLTEEDAALIRDRWINKRTYREIGDRLGVTQTTARNRTMKAEAIILNQILPPGTRVYCGHKSSNWRLSFSSHSGSIAAPFPSPNLCEVLLDEPALPFDESEESVASIFVDAFALSILVESKQD